jgi:hypothetical protein
MCFSILLCVGRGRLQEGQPQPAIERAPGPSQGIRRVARRGERGRAQQRLDALCPGQGPVRRRGASPRSLRETDAPQRLAAFPPGPAGAGHPESTAPWGVPDLA